jgi:hypothetical protein
MAKDKSNNRNTGVQQPEVKDETVKDTVLGDEQLEVNANTDTIVKSDTEVNDEVDATLTETTESNEPLKEVDAENDQDGAEDDQDLNGQDEDTVEPVVLSEDEELSRIEKLIADIEIDTDGTLVAISTSSILVFSVLASKLMDYRDQMHTSKGLMDVKVGAVKNGQLYKTIMNILSNKDEKYFRIGFSLINIVFKTYNGEDEAYNKYVLTRYDSGWDNQKDLSTYNKLVTIIPRLSDASTREEEKIKIDFDKLRDKVKTNFTDLIVDRLVAYYNV